MCQSGEKSILLSIFWKTFF